MQQIKTVPRDQWNVATVSNIVSTCARSNTVSPDTDAMKVLSQMNRTGVRRVMVAAGDRLLGIVTMGDLMRFLAIKMELEGESGNGQLVARQEEVGTRNED